MPSPHRILARRAANHDARGTIGRKLERVTPHAPNQRLFGHDHDLGDFFAFAAKIRIDHPSIGRPAISTNCFGRPNRSPRPAAAITAPQLIVPAYSFFGRAKIIRPATVCSTRVTTTSTVVADQPPSVLDHDHRSVVQIRHTLVRLFPFPNHVDVQLLTGQHDRL